MAVTIDGSTGVTTNAGGLVNPSTTIDGINYSCRAWVNFNGTTATPSTIRGSGNVTSVTKNGTGDYTVNFTTAMPDTNYSVTGSGCERSASASWFYVSTTLTGFATGSIRIGVRDYNSAQDGQFVGVAIFR